MDVVVEVRREGSCTEEGDGGGIAGTGEAETERRGQQVRRRAAVFILCAMNMDQASRRVGMMTTERGERESSRPGNRAERRRERVRRGHVTACPLFSPPPSESRRSRLSAFSSVLHSLRLLATMDIDGVRSKSCMRAALVLTVQERYSAYASVQPVRTRSRSTSSGPSLRLLRC
jgi:hypothetical protein